MNGGAMAMPFASVITAGLPANVPDAPAAGAAKSTVTPESGAWDASTTRACSAIPNAVWTAAACGVPAIACMAAGGAAMYVNASNSVTEKELGGGGITDTCTTAKPVGAAGVSATIRVGVTLTILAFWPPIITTVCAGKPVPLMAIS